MFKGLSDRSRSGGFFAKNRISLNEKGFALTWLILLLPIWIAACFFFFRQAEVVLVDRDNRAQCRTELLDTQKKTGVLIEKLLALNPLIRAAKATKAAALVAMAAATAAANPPAFAAAAKVYESAENSLRALRFAQKTLIARAGFEMAEGLRRVHVVLEKRWRLSPQVLQKVAGGSVFPGLPHLAVRPANPADPYPEYVLEENFSVRQALQVSWKIQFAANKENKSWNKADWTYHRACSATLVAKGQAPPLTAKLSADKFSSKSFFFF